MGAVTHFCPTVRSTGTTSLGTTFAAARAPQFSAPEECLYCTATPRCTQFLEPPPPPSPHEQRAGTGWGGHHACAASRRLPNALHIYHRGPLRWAPVVGRDGWSTGHHACNPLDQQHHQGGRVASPSACPHAWSAGVGRSSSTTTTIILGLRRGQDAEHGGAFLSLGSCGCGWGCGSAPFPVWPA